MPLPYGTTAFRPSCPPLSCTTTSVRWPVGVADGTTGAGALIAVSVSTIPHIAHVVAPPIDAPPPTSEQVIQQFQALEHHESHGAWISKGFGFVALILAAVNIFGGFLVTARMLAMYKKKAK